MKLITHDHRLDVLRVSVASALSRYELRDVDHELRLLEHVGADLAIELHAHLVGRRVRGQEIRYPATWWDAVKVRFFPPWLLRRYPPVLVVLTPQMTELFPDVRPLRGQRSFVIREFAGEMEMLP